MVYKLDERLTAIAVLAPVCECAADIGADHGRLGAHLLLAGRAEVVQFLDISPDSLLKARRLIERMGLERRALFSVGDGVAALIRPAGAVIIAGMGGQLISDIVERGRDVLSGSTLILQPNVAQRELRRRLNENGFAINAERIVRAASRWYVIIRAAAGDARCTPEEQVIGPCIMRDRPPELVPYARRQVAILAKALAGARAGGAAWTEELEYELKCWEEAVAYGESERNTGAD